MDINNEQENPLYDFILKIDFANKEIIINSKNSEDTLLSLTFNNYKLSDIIKLNKDNLNMRFFKLTKIKSSLFINNIIGIVQDVIFINPIKVRYINIHNNDKNIIIIDKNVYSTLQINETLKIYNIDKINFLYNGELYDYNEHKYLLIFNGGETIDFINIKKVYQLSFTENVINENGTKFKKNILSKYFSNYFESLTNDEDFIFYKSEQRKNLLQNLFIFFKIT